MPRPRQNTTRPSTGSRCSRFPVEGRVRSEEHTSELQSVRHLVCRLLLEKKKKKQKPNKQKKEKTQSTQHAHMKTSTEQPSRSSRYQVTSDFGHSNDTSTAQTEQCHSNP